MPDSLSGLEHQRAAILARIVDLGDFRSGSITAINGRCGKPECRCHQPNQPGHGPNYRLTRKVNGKTISETFASPAELRKAQREVETFHRFRELSGELLEVNEKVCRLRPLEDTLTPQEKKTAETIRREVTQEVDQLLRIIFQERRKTGRMDLEATEMAMRSAMHHAGSTALNELLQFPPPAAEQRSIPCSCGHQAGYQELRSKPVLTAVGEVTVARPYYLCPHCHNGQFPADVELDIQGTESSPGVRRMLATLGHEAAFDHGRQQMKLLAGLEVTTKAVERTAEAIGEDIAAREQAEILRAMQLDLPTIVGEPISILYVQVDGTGVPVVKKETIGRQGKTEGKSAHTREAKLGCVFTQTTWDDEGYAVRDPDSTTYVGAIESSEEFGKRIYLEAWKRGWSRAQTKVFMGDGSEWIWNIANLHFPGAIQIVDLFHARQHLWDLARKIYPNQEAEQRRWMMVHQNLLDGGKIEDLVSVLRAIDSPNPELADKLRVEAGYLENNGERMRYPKFRDQHLFVGTGVIEAGCKALIGARCKQSGMFWTLRGANAILALRCCQFNGRFEDYWEARRA